MLTQRRGIYIYKLKGHITVNHMININSTLSQYKNKPLLFDLTECESIDISILLMIVSLLHKDKKSNIKFFGMKEHIKLLLINKKIDNMFNTFNNVNEGINSYGEVGMLNK
jgi:anti-anti-sigma regulatory factor